MEKISKRFPAEVSLEVETFLNDKKVDGELYAFFQELSFVNKGRTVVYKSSLPTQKEIGEKIKCSAKTYTRHRDYLIEKGYLIDKGSFYELPNKEDVFLLIPLKTLQFLNDNLREHVVKIYTYLGQRWKYKGSDWNFTYDELGKHIGLNVTYNRNLITIRNAVLCLQKLGLIDYEDITIRTEGSTINKKRLTKFVLVLDGTE